jgi:hypothetical protein
MPKFSMSLRNLVIFPSLPVISIASPFGCTSTILARKINVTYLHHLRPALRVCVHPEHHEFAIDKLTVAKILDLNDVYQLAELAGYLFKNRIIAPDDDSHPRGRRIAGRRNIQTVYIESASAKHPSDAGKDTKPVLHQDRDRVTHS